MKYMILDPRADHKLVQCAEKLGFKVVPADYIHGIDTSVAGHPDMQLVKVGNKVIVNPHSFEHYKKHLKGVELICGKTVVQGKYPEYTAYNIALGGGVAIHNFKHTDPVVLEELNGFEKINVKQGYTKFSVVTTPYGIITADKGIVKACRESGITCIETAPGDISLEGKDNGFIGGASGYSDGVLYFSGDVTKHPDFDKIKKFCDEKGIEILCLSNDKLADVGSIIII